jgi:hypothetical protein
MSSPSLVLKVQARVSPPPRSRVVAREIDRLAETNGVGWDGLGCVLGTLLNRLFGTNFDVMDESRRQQTTKGEPPLPPPFMYTIGATLFLVANPPPITISPDRYLVITLRLLPDDRHGRRRYRWERTRRRSRFREEERLV